MSPPPVWMVGSGGRTPFVGHFRGLRTVGDTVLAWAGRIAASASVTDGWAAAEQARDALADAALVPGSPPATLLADATRALTHIDGRWLVRGDLSVLLVSRGPSGVWATGSGLGGVWGRGPWGGGPTGTRMAFPADHPLLGEPGVLPAGAWECPPGVDVFIGVPTGLAFPSGPAEVACGVRA